MKEVRELTIRDSTSGKTITLDCTRLLRRIEGRRSVYEGRFEGKPVIIKRFTSALQGKHHFIKEVHGLKELTLRHIKTSQIAAAGPDDRDDHVIALEKIENAVDVFQLLEFPNADIDTDAVLGEVAACIAQMHAAGVHQQDLHTGNFLWDGDSIYVLDPAKMTFSPDPLNKESSFEQLAVFFASLPELERAKKVKLLERYFASRGWPFDTAALAAIDALTEQQRLKRLSRTLRKTLRTSKRYIHFKEGTCQGVFCRELFSGQEFSGFLGSIDSRMEAGRVLKRGNTCFVSRIDLNGYDVVVKRYNHKSLWHSFRHTLKGSRAKKCWLFGHRLRELGIAAAKPLGFFEKCKFGLVWESYILNVFIPGANIHDYLTDAAIPDSRKSEVSRRTRQMLEDLVHFQITHGDLKPGNILIERERPVLIDLDSMKRHRSRIMLQRWQRKMNDTISKRQVVWKT